MQEVGGRQVQSGESVVDRCGTTRRDLKKQKTHTEEGEFERELGHTRKRERDHTELVLILSQDVTDWPGSLNYMWWLRCLIKRSFIQMLGRCIP